MKLHAILIASASLSAATTRLTTNRRPNQIVVTNQQGHGHSQESKIIHIVRHGQAYNNLGHYDWLDPNLTDKGLHQARELGNEWSESDSIEVVVASPQIRALNTTLNLLDVLSSRNIALPDFVAKPIIALPELQELGSSPSSRGHLRSDLEEMLGHPPPFPVDLDLLTPDWNGTKGYWNRSKPASIARAEMVREWLFSREEQNIAVVGHDANLKLLVNYTCFRDHEHRCQGWHNAQVRHFQLGRSADSHSHFIEMEAGQSR